ncbi:malonate decarboxylase holo-[acyl-carrier-protein] synthase [Orrella sp. JC864]|uniref:malonate decarboxylase holo-[acyl-carrier-protein] synthase n=1 Tax=Orrella sp. JC864 TaxID=3120298 RepID=UPI0012BB6C74
MTTPPARHDLLWLLPGAAAALAGPLRAAGNAADADVIEPWLAQGRPVVLGRQPEGLDPRWWAAGLPLPPAQGKRRIALRVRRDWVARRAQALPLEQAAAAAPPAWRGPLAALQAQAGRIGLPLRVFGSLAWQRLTGMQYVQAGSDLDLLWHAGDAERCAAACALLARWQAGCGIAVDGELVFGADSAVSWREWQRATRHDDPRAQVLVKRFQGAALLPVCALRRMMPALPAAAHEAPAC